MSAVKIAAYPTRLAMLVGVGVLSSCVATAPSTGSPVEASLGTKQLCIRDDHGAVACRIMSHARVFHPIDSGATQIASSWSTGCARMPDATVRCTGNNEHGQLGDGTTTRHMDDAVTVAGLDHVDQILAGNEGPAAYPPNIEFGFTCARLGSEIRCWGSFADTMDGPLVDHLTPVTITF